MAAIIILAWRRRTATWCIGIKTAPFAAHAWVALDGLAIGERSEVAGYQLIFTTDQRDAAMDPVSQALSIVDYDGFVTEPDGTKLAQSSSPAIIERMLRLADLRPGQRVLEVGTGSGYSAALLSTLVRSHGHVVSIDIDPGLVTRARQRHATTANLTIVVGDGAEGASDHHPFDRIIGWTTPALLPAIWLAQAIETALIVTPVKVAAVATANLVARVPVHAGHPMPATLCAGSFVDCDPKVSYEFAVPAHYVDAATTTAGGAAWLSAPALRDQPGQAKQLLEQLVTTPTVTPHDMDSSLILDALARHLFVTATDALAAGCLPVTGRGFGVATPTGIAILLPRAYYSAGDHDALTRLCELVAGWESIGRPEHTQLDAVLTRAYNGWFVRAISRSRDPAIPPSTSWPRPPGCS